MIFEIFVKSGLVFKKISICYLKSGLLLIIESKVDDNDGFSEDLTPFEASFIEDCF